MIDVRILRPDEASLLDHVADGVFDNAIDRAAAAEHTRDPRMHLAAAIDDGLVVGFASAIHYVHPDKPVPQLWIDEVGVADSHLRLGLASRLLAVLFEHGRALGCEEAWVLTDRENEAAMGLYAKAGGLPADTVIFTFPLGSDPTDR